MKKPIEIIISPQSLNAINPIRAIENEKCCKKQDWEEMDRDFGDGDKEIFIMYKCTNCGVKIMDIFAHVETIKGWEL